MTLSTADLAYAAALVDNYATLKTRTVRETELPEITIQGRIPALPWLAERCGVKLIEITKGYARHQCTEHCPDKHMTIESRTQRFQVTGARATVVLYCIESFMRVQGRQARDLVEVGRATGFKTNVVNDMARLGWALPDLKRQPRARLEIAQ